MTDLVPPGDHPHRSIIRSSPGCPLPLGPTRKGHNVNFSLFCRQAIRVELILYTPGERTANYEFPLMTPEHCTGDIWHIEIHNVPSNVEYAYRISTEESDRCATPQLALDPYARRITGGERWGQKVVQGGWRCGLEDDDFDWAGDHPLRRPLKDAIIYELHVRGFTRHPSAQVKHPGTFLGIIEKIPYLQSLGITAVELLPLSEFDENENKASDPLTGTTLKNFWGYSPLAYFAPKASFAAKSGQQVREFKTMVKALHKAGIEVILDVVFNHTGEGNGYGPAISFKVLGNNIYYLVDQKTKEYLNFSGCGNTVNCNHPVVREFIVDCLRYWVTEMHVDGFRFDLASIMSRGQRGEVLSQPPLVEQIAEDPILAHTKIIAEAWDATGLYQVGHFSSNPRWAEWNGRFRDDVRAFMAGYPHMTAKLATRVAGSSDLYQHNQRHPSNSINFLTSHDGFTLWDLVSYNDKHNERNGEGNRDGDNNNLSWNSGKEGFSKSLKVQTIRARRLRSMALVLLLSQGVPMLLAGDEFCRTQRGNNNAYCQDNSISWLDWRLLESHADTFRFFQMLIRFRKRHRHFRRADFFSPPSMLHPAEIIWQGAKRGREDWTHENKLLCFMLLGDKTLSEPDFWVIISADSHETTVELPLSSNGKVWRQVIDTALVSPHDIVPESEALPVAGNSISVAPLAAMVLIAGGPTP